MKVTETGYRDHRGYHLKTIRPQWLALIDDFADRFMIGSDNIGHFKSYNQNILKYYVLLDVLSPAKAEMVALKNFPGLLPSK